MNNLFYIFFNTYLFLSIFLGWTFPRWNNLQDNYFIFGILFLYIYASFFLKPIRNLRNIWLGLFIFLSLISIFFHNYYCSGTTERFINFSLMSEGFIYVLCGALFYKLIYEYAKADLRYYPCLWIALILLLSNYIQQRMLTPLFIISLSSVIYCFLKRKRALSYILLLFFIFGVYLYRDLLIMRVFIRAATHWETLKEIAIRPLGYGFVNTLTGNLVFINPDKFYTPLFKSVIISVNGGFVYRHNDFLNIARDLGIFTIPLIMGFLLTIFKKVNLRKIEPLAYLCLTILVICYFQITMYRVKNAIVIIPLFSLLGVRRYA